MKEGAREEFSQLDILSPQQWNFFDNQNRPVALDINSGLGRQLRRAQRYLEQTESKKDDDILKVYRQNIITLLERILAHKKSCNNSLEDFWSQADVHKETGARLCELLMVEIDSADKSWMVFPPVET